MPDECQPVHAHAGRAADRAEPDDRRCRRAHDRRSNRARRAQRARVFDIQREPERGRRPDRLDLGPRDVRSAAPTSTNGDAGGNILNRGQPDAQRGSGSTNGQTTGGRAAGIANVGGTLTITHSLVENNLELRHPAARRHRPAGSTTPALAPQIGHLTIDNSTLVNNSAQAGGAGRHLEPLHALHEHTRRSPTRRSRPTTAALRRRTPAGSLPPRPPRSRCRTRSSPPTRSAAEARSPTARAQPQITSLGHNLETGSDCGFTATGDLQNIDPLFLTGGVADTGGNTDTIALSANSPAVDAIPAGAPGCSGTDQRDIARPQGIGLRHRRVRAHAARRRAASSRRCSARSTTEPTPSIDWGDGTPHVECHGVSDPDDRPRSPARTRTPRQASTTA